MRKIKNIRHTKSHLVKGRISLINRVIRECVTESFNSEKPTDYEILKDGMTTIFRFTTDGGNSYDLEFIPTFLSRDYEIEQGGVLGDYNKQRGDLFIGIDVAFVPSEINISDRDDHELYTKETNRGEQFELMSRIAYLVGIYISESEINIYVIGKDTKTMKLKIYENLFNNIFSDEFTKLDGQNEHYDGGSYYFIKK